MNLNFYNKFKYNRIIDFISANKKANKKRIEATSDLHRFLYNGLF